MWASQPQILTYLRFGLLPFHISYGVETTNLVETLFNRYAVISRAYPQNDTGRSAKFIKDRTMLNKVRFFLSFYFQVHDSINKLFVDVPFQETQLS